MHPHHAPTDTRFPTQRVDVRARTARDGVAGYRGRQTWMMSRIEMIPSTSPSCTTTR